MGSNKDGIRWKIREAIEGELERKDLLKYNLGARRC